MRSSDSLAKERRQALLWRVCQLENYPPKFYHSRQQKQDKKAAKCKPIRKLSTGGRKHELDYNMKQDGIKRKHKNAAMYLDTIQRLCLNVLSKWRSNRKKKCDKARGNAELMRKCSFNFAFIKELLSLK